MSSPLLKKTRNGLNRQKEKDMFVVIGNPLLTMRGKTMKTKITRIVNTHPLTNRLRIHTQKIPKHDSVDKLYDPYVRAFFWASERIGDTGVVAFVTNNSFITERTFDGMRKHLAERIQCSLSA